MENLEGIAIVGMAGRFPGARNLDAFWENLCKGVESITHFSDEELLDAGITEDLLKNPNYVKAHSIIDDVELFDADYFGYNPREAEILDPQQRIFLECAVTALEDAAYDPKRYAGLIGVFAGAGGFDTYLKSNLMTNQDFFKLFGSYQIFLANENDFLATRAAYKLDLKGPAFTLQTACSTSLVAVHVACQNLLSYQCDMALAGGVRVSIPHKTGYLFQEGSILSPDGHCRPFDADAKGTVPGEGAGIVVLKRLEDALEDKDHIYAVIRGSAYNNDGSDKAGYTAPSVDGQLEAISMALAVADVEPSSIGYIETHGTGTPVGDPIEITALKEAYGKERNGNCAIGSVKSNIGHTDTAAGIAGLIKTALILKHKKIPQTLHYKKANPAIDFENSPFYVNTELKEWKSESPRRAGVSAFGLGGTNAHVVLQEFQNVTSKKQITRSHQLIGFSGKGQEVIDQSAKDLSEWFANDPNIDLSNASFSLFMGRTFYKNRRIVVASDLAEAQKALASMDPESVFSSQTELSDRPLTFMFAGGGAQYPNMGLHLYQEEALYREQVDQCLDLLKSRMSLDIMDLLFPSAENFQSAAEQLQKPSLALPALFTTSYSLAKLLISWGLEPVNMIGHSMGEYVAACLAGTFKLEDALMLVTVRGQLFETLPEGAMLSVPMSAEDLKPLMEDSLDFAAINGPQLCVASGPVLAIDKLQQTLESKEIDCTRIKISVAAHSGMLEPILEQFRKVFQGIELQEPQIPFVSNMSGDMITAEEAVDPSYWVSHLRQTVKFSQGLSKILDDKDMVLLEVGPGKTLSSLAKQHPEKVQSQPVFSTLRHPKEEIHDGRFLLNVLGGLWLKGVNINWEEFFEDQGAARVSLPTYPFQRKRFWVEPGTQVLNDPSTSGGKRSDLSEWFYMPSWRKTLTPATSKKSTTDCLVVFHNREPWLESLLEEIGGTNIQVVAGSEYREEGSKNFTIDPSNQEHFAALMGKVHDTKADSIQFLYLWSYQNQHGLKEAKLVNFYCPLFLAQAISQFNWTQTLDIRLVAGSMCFVESQDQIIAEKSLLVGPCRVIPLEIPKVSCQIIDAVPGELHLSQRSLFLKELAAPITDPVLAYRGQHRYVEAFEGTPLDKTAGGDPILKENGTYLITGGLGGVGLAIAKRISSEVSANLILLGRSEFPSKDKWADLVGSTSPHASTIKDLMDFENKGCKVLVLASDVSDNNSLSEAILEAKSVFGPIHGVVHAAGVLRDGTIPLKSEEDAETVFAPKVIGTINLEENLKKEPLDFFVLCSALSTVTGSVAQIDYVSANAFLNGFVTKNYLENNNCKYLSVYWGTWKEAGMAARLANQNGAPQRPELPETALESPFPWWELMWEENSSKVFKTDYELGAYWVLDEHRIKDGEALIPGTGYLELLRGALETESPLIVIKDVFFQAPFVVTPNSKNSLYLKIDVSAETREFVFYSYSGTSSIEHVRGTFEVDHKQTPEKHDLVKLLERCNNREADSLRQDSHLELGPRWKSLKGLHIGEGEGLCELELPEEFVSDLAIHKLHPALLDVATSGAKPLIPGFDPEKDFHLAFGYGSLTYFAPLERKLFSYLRYQADSSTKEGLALFDIWILNAKGEELLKISDFMIKNVGQGYQVQSVDTGTEQPENGPQKLGNSVLATALSDGMLSDEGTEAFIRTLRSTGSTQIIVSPIDLAVLQRMVLNSSVELQDDERQTSMQHHSRPQLTTTFVAPRNDVELQIAEVWQNVLGIDQIGVYDDFFELGGHSLMFTQIISRLRETIDVNISIKDLFEKPTIAGITDKIKNSSDKNEPSAPKIVRVSRETYRANDS